MRRDAFVEWASLWRDLRLPLGQLSHRHISPALAPLSTSPRLDRIDQPVLPLNEIFHPVGTGSGVHIYVLDTGILSTHEDFTGRVGAWLVAGGSPRDSAARVLPRSM